MNSIPQRIAEELSAQIEQVETAVLLLDAGATVPFIARYRKEATGGLDDAQLRKLEERLHYLRELEERRTVILNSIKEQDKLTPELEADIKAADTKVRLEDLYLPYKPKRRTKAQIAREAGLEPLADALLNDPGLEPEQAAAAYVDPDKKVADVKAALEGARQILMERFAEDAELIGDLREYLWENAKLAGKVAEGMEETGAKFTDYFDYAEAIKAIPSHRALALFRGRNEKVLQLDLQEPEQPSAYCEGRIAARFQIEDKDRPADRWLSDTVRWTWRVKIRTHLEVELLMRLREAAETEAIKVFAGNARDLLMAPPAGQRATIGLDPGLRTGVKVAVVDNTGKLVEYGAIYPHAPKNQWDLSIKVLAELTRKFRVELIAIGNGTASRETDRLVDMLIKQHPKLKLQKLMVSEAGASVYSASELASLEFPDLDVTIRGAVSIARRLQDPLAELVKIEPKSIGVGQYQHDLNQPQLARTLDTVVEDCVNAVGVDVNTASAPLLAQVSGLNRGLAGNIIEYRNNNGAFRDRKQFLEVPRLGKKAFEQAAGFLRINNGDNPLDISAVHPEAYPVVERIVKKNERTVKNLMGDSSFLHALKPEDYTDTVFGIPTVTDIINELEKPGRDPRPEFKTATFKEGVEEIAHLRPDMILEGVITNVTNFGAFVDIGVHQDGLVHISALADKFVKDPRNEVKAGDIVKVKVLDVDIKRRRIALTMRLEDQSRQYVPTNNREASAKQGKNKRTEKRVPEKPRSAFGNALAEALAKVDNS
ncbi:MAG: RNA-binding transcriptional accessory protein [Gammaproteobacteria bacterium]|nr:RNA-binding transcriptional accessory protein [Gammaproteobacteria bacterium]